MASRELKNIHRLIGAAVNELPPEKSFLSDLKACIVKLSEHAGHPPSQKYKPSSMHCVRNMYFQVVGEQADPDPGSPELIGMGESGTERHKDLQAAIAAMSSFGMECEFIDVEDYIQQQGLTHLQVVERRGAETKLYYPELNLSFMCDGIIRYRGKYYILEIKTEVSYKWQSREGVAKEHYLQASAYSLAFGINEVLFLYECRDDCSKKAYLLQVTPEMKMAVIEKIQLCDQHVAKITPPDVPADVTKKGCSYCGYRTACRRYGGWIWQ